MNMLKKALIGVVLGTLSYNANAVEIKSVSDLDLGLYEQEHKPLRDEEALAPRYVNINNTALSFNTEIDSKGFVFIEITGVDATSLKSFGIFVKTLKSGFVEAGTLIDYTDNGVTYQLGYNEDPDYLYLSTNDNLDDPNITGNPDNGQDITRSKMSNNKPFEGKVQFYLLSDNTHEINEDVTIRVSKVLDESGQEITIPDSEKVTVVDLENTLKAVLVEDKLTFVSDFDIRYVPQQRFDFSIKGIPENFIVQVEDELCEGGSVCDFTVYMAPESNRVVKIEKPDMYLDFEITADVLVNSKHNTETSVLLSEKSNLYMYTVPYSYHIERDKRYYTVFNLFSENTTEVFMDITLTSVGNGINKDIVEFKDVSLYELETVSTFTLKELIDIVGVEDGNYHAKVVFKSYETLTINVDNVSPNGRTTVNVESK